MVDGYTCTAITGRTTTPNKSTSAQLHGHELAEHAGELGDTGCNQKNHSIDNSLQTLVAVPQNLRIETKELEVEEQEL